MPNPPKNAKRPTDRQPKATRPKAGVGSIEALVSERDPKPYVYKTQTGHEVIFPDPGELDWEEAEEWLEDMARMRNSEALAKWLSEEDYQALREEALNLRQMAKLLLIVQRHYGDIFGELGEGPASRA